MVYKHTFITRSFEAVLKDGLSVFQNSRPNVVKASKLFGLKIYFHTSLFRYPTGDTPYFLLNAVEKKLWSQNPSIAEISPIV